MHLKIIALPSLQPWHHGKGELQCAQQKLQRCEEKKKRQKDKEKPYAAFVAEKREMGTVLRGSNYLVAETTFAAAEAYEHLCCLQAFLLKHLP